jgi:hypothetical protein
VATRQEKERRRSARLARERALAGAERRRRILGRAIAAVLAAAALAAIVVAATAGLGGRTAGPSSSTAGLEHIHGLGVNPADGSLLIATHTGLFRAPAGTSKPIRIGTSQQDVMGFSVVGPDRFLGSGHPGPDQNLPPLLGLIESRDGGRSWKSISLMGQADFHVLRSAGNRVYGFNSAAGALMTSANGGRTWADLRPPGPVIDLAIDPRDPSHAVASTDQALVTSADAGRTWRTLQPGVVGLLTWPTASQVYWIDAQGTVHQSSNAGRTWHQTGGSIGGQPAAFASHQTDLYAALVDGTVKQSADSGRSWTVRATP